jgi:HSP20 family molecular chaperone IbpA
MDGNSNANANENANTNTLNVDLEQIAVAGLKLFDSFVKTSEPIIKTFSQFENNVSTSYQTRSCNSVKQPLKYKKNITIDYVYLAVEIPRISRANCDIKLVNDLICLNAKMDNSELGFEFLPLNEYKLEIKLPEKPSQSDIKANYKNGMLYIIIKRNQINSDRIDINILD